MQSEVIDGLTTVVLMRGGFSSMLAGLLMAVFGLPFVAAGLVCIAGGVFLALQKGEALHFDPVSETLVYQKDYAIPLLDEQWVVPASHVRSVKVKESQGDDTTWTVTVGFYGKSHAVYSGSSQQTAEQLVDFLNGLTHAEIVRESTKSS